MRARTLVLLLLALVLGGGTMMLVRSWLVQRTAEVEAMPLSRAAAPGKSVLVARGTISRGQILKPADFSWQGWPEGGIDKAYIQAGTKTAESFTGWVARDPFVAGEPISDSKIVAPGSRGFLAAALAPGMRAVSVPGGGSADAKREAAETVLHDVRVIAVDQKLDSKNGEALIAHTATLEVTPKQSEIIAVATEIGKLSLSLRSLAAGPGDKRPADSPAGDAQGTFTLDSEVSQLL